MSYSYCKHCEEGMPKPSIRECLEESQNCPHCGGINKVYYAKDVLATHLEDLEERIQKLEKHNDP